MCRLPPSSPLFPYTTLFRSGIVRLGEDRRRAAAPHEIAQSRPAGQQVRPPAHVALEPARGNARVLEEPLLRSEEHTSELQSHSDLVCRLLLEKKKNRKHNTE